MVESKFGKHLTSEQFLDRRSAAPVISNTMVSSVSQFRRDVLEDEVDQGKFRTGSTQNNYATPDRFGPTQAGFVTSNARTVMKKTATVSSGSNGYSGGGGTVRQSPDIYTPMLTNSNLSLPRDRNTMNSWSRIFFALNGIVQNAISLHATYPISKLSIKCKQKAHEKFFMDMIEEIDLMNLCVQIAQEYWILGEAFVYAELDEQNRKWSRILIQNPDFINVERSVVENEPIISMRPDANLINVCKSNKPAAIQQRQKLDKSIIEHVRRGENIPLNNFYVSHIARKINPYDVRGTGLIVSSFRQLMLFDRLRESKFAQADNLINPLTLVKVGGEDYKPTPADLDSWRQIFEEAQNDKDFKIFTHDKVAVERVGANSAIIDTGPDITQLIKEIFIGLMVPSVLMDGGQDTTYANGSVALDVLRQRYMQFRQMLTIWLRRKIFAPIAKINDFYEYVDKKKTLVVPEIEWNHMSLFDAGDYINTLTTLATSENKVVSHQTLYRSLGLVWEDEVQKIRAEDVQEAIRAKEKQSLEQMSLNELRALGDNDEIQEPTNSPIDGESADGAPAGAEDEGLPGVPPPPDMGGASPMPPPPEPPPPPPPGPPSP